MGYQAKCGSFYPGRFGEVLCAFKFYDILIVQGSNSTNKKFTPVTPDEQNEAVWKLQITKNLVHSYLLQVHDVIFEPLFMNVVLVTELPINSLYNVLHIPSPLPDNKILDNTTKLRVIKNIVSAVQYLHDNDIVHTDISTSNIFLFQKEGQIFAKLGGYGVSLYLYHLAIDKLKRKSVSGKYLRYTMAILAPELLKMLSEGESPEYTKETDVYALGISLNEIMAGRHPYPYADDHEYIIENIMGKGERPEMFVPSKDSHVENALCQIIGGTENNSFFFLAEEKHNRPKIEYLSEFFTLLNDKGIF